jgi:O-acetyl-ADP-ribose deacetylase (regulator of RNase III)
LLDHGVPSVREVAHTNASQFSLSSSAMNQVVLYSAFFSLLLGLSIYLWVSSRREIDNFYTTLQICWLLIALFPVLLIFSFFPDSSISGTVKGVSIGGAIGAFGLVWWYGTSQSLKASGLDDRLRICKASLKEKQGALDSLAISSPGSQIPSIALPISTSQRFMYRLNRNHQCQVGLITGDIRDVHDVDVWVSSENTNMQMARFYESSISGIIRYWGAERDTAGYVSDDVVAKELKREMKDKTHVQPGTVLVTSSGNLTQSNGVKRIFHVASVQGEVGYGYKPIRGVSRCIKNCLDRMNSSEFKELGLTSILFPLIGAGRANGDLNEIAKDLIQTAIAHQENVVGSTIKEIYFLAWTDVELEACRRIFESELKLKRGKND